MIAVIIGSPLAGKTTLMKRLSEEGIKVFSADTFIKQIYKRGNIGYLTIKEQLGAHLLNEEGVDRVALAQFVSNPENLKRINEIIHPHIKEYLEGKDGYVAELPLITTSPVKFNYDKVILVKASPEVIKERFDSKQFAPTELIDKIIETWDKEVEADIVVDTTNGIKDSDISNIIKLFNEK